MPAQPTQLFVDDETVRLTREGTWLSNGEEITHREQCRAFARNLGHDKNGWFIRIGNDFKRIEVEDTAYFVEGLDGDAEAGYRVRLNDETWELMDPRSLSYRIGRLTCRVRGGSVEAKFLTSPYVEVLANLLEDSESYFLVIQGIRVSLARKD